VAPSGIGAKKVQEISENSEITYNASFVAFECAAIDLHNGTILSSNSSALKVACPPPGHREKSGKADHHSSTYLEVSGVGVKD
jgi:hypothetical protein